MRGILYLLLRMNVESSTCILARIQTWLDPSTGRPAQHSATCWVMTSLSTSIPCPEEDRLKQESETVGRLWTSVQLTDSVLLDRVRGTFPVYLEQFTSATFPWHLTSDLMHSLHRLNEYLWSCCKSWHRFARPRDLCCFTYGAFKKYSIQLNYEQEQFKRKLNGRRIIRPTSTTFVSFCLQGPCGEAFDVFNSWIH